MQRLFWHFDKLYILFLCQAHGIPPAIKYESYGGSGIAEIMKLLMGSKNALADRDAFIRLRYIRR